MLDEFTTADIIVVADSSTDRTAQLAKGILRKRGSVLLTTAGAAGSVRAVAANYALSRNRQRLDRWWLANTDADCVVPRGWLADQLQLARRGIEAFAGTVSVDSFEEHGPQVAERFRASYMIASDGWHPHVHGANLGVRADRYVSVGGWSAQQTGEDHDLWDRLVARDTSWFRQRGTLLRRITRRRHGIGETVGNPANSAPAGNRRRHRRTTVGWEFRRRYPSQAPNHSRCGFDCHHLRNIDRYL
jgi:glycosyltransferase involved in cell wall biosynthesis